MSSAHSTLVSVLIPKSSFATVAALVTTLILCMLPPSGARVKQQDWPVTIAKEELKKKLTPMQYYVTQERGTER